VSGSNGGCSNARAALSNAIRYWERRRIAYNAVLLVIVVVMFTVNLPGSRANGSVNTLLMLFVLAVLANAAYCAAYIVDVAAQLSVFRYTWLRVRWVLAAIGTAFAGVLTYFFSTSLFGQSA
jgi:hypothetical protein